MELLIIKNESGSENISSALLLKIYETAILTNNILLLEGTVIVPHAKQSVLNYFEDNFPNFHIVLTGLKYIEFVDPIVSWHIAKSYDPDGIGITLSDLNSINWITTSMGGNTLITTFDELSLFTNITTLKNSAFKGCTSLTSLNISNIITFEEECLRDCSSLGVNQTLDMDLDGKYFNSNCFRGTGWKEIVLHETTEHKISLFLGAGLYDTFGVQMPNLVKYDLSDTKQTTSTGILYSDNLTTLIYPETQTYLDLRGRDYGNSILYIICLSKNLDDVSQNTYWEWYNNQNGKIYVQDDVYDTYIQMPGWAALNNAGRVAKISLLPSSITWYTKEHPTG